MSYYRHLQGKSFFRKDELSSLFLPFYQYFSQKNQPLRKKMTSPKFFLNNRWFSSFSSPFYWELAAIWLVATDLLYNTIVVYATPKIFIAVDPHKHWYPQRLGRKMDFLISKKSKKWVNYRIILRFFIETESTIAINFSTSVDSLWVGI